MKERLILIGIVTAAIILVMLLVYWLRPREKYPYVERELLTSREYEFYQVLAPIAQKHGWLLLIKLRLADILAVAPQTDNYMTHFNKIKAKHTDFVLYVPQTLEVLAGIELDDPSHEREERKARDIFVDNAYAAAGIPLIHVWMGAEPEELEQLLLEFVPSLAEEEEIETEAPAPLPEIVETGTEEDLPSMI